MWDIHLQSFTNANSLELKNPLGTWTRNHSTSGRWKSYQDMNAVYRWISKDSGWKIYKVYGNCLIGSCERVTTIKYDNMTPVKIYTLGSKCFVCCPTYFIPPKCTKVYGPNVSWDKFVQGQPAWSNSLLQNVFFFTDNGELDMELIWSNIQTYGYLLMVSEWSVCYLSSMSFG